MIKYSRTIKTTKTAHAPSVIFTILSLCLAPSALATSGNTLATSNTSSNFSVNVQDVPKLTIVVPSSIVLNITPVDKEGTFGTTSNFNIVVGTSNYSGYTLSMSAAGSGAITHTTDSSSTINPLPVLSSGYSESDFKSLSTTKNTWGYTIVSSHLPESNNGKYYSINNGNDIEATINTNTTPVNNDTTTLSFASKVDSTIPSGSYTATITFTAITNSLPLYMQEVDTWKDTLSVNESIQALDMRDNKLYWVTKLETDPNIPELLPNTSSTNTSAGARAECEGEGANRHCYQIWTTQNLDLDLTPAVTFTHYNTDLGYTTNNADAVWTPEKRTATELAEQTNMNCVAQECSYDDGEKYIYSSGSTADDTVYASLSQCTQDGHTEEDCLHYSAGNFYNFRTATALNATDTATITNTNYSYMPNSVCPAGWRLPTGLTAADGYSDFDYILYANGITRAHSGVNNNLAYTTNGFNLVRSLPLWFVRGGLVIVSQGTPAQNHQGVSARYWTGSTVDATQGYRLYFANNNIKPADTNYWTHEVSVRCIARQLPLDFVQAVRFKKGVGFAEMVVAKEAAVSGKRRGMWRFQDEMASAIYEGLLVSGVAPPEDENQVRAGFVQIFYGSSGESLPALAAVRASMVCFYGKHRVQKQYALLLPTAQATGLIFVVTDVGVYLFININERRRNRLRIWH